MAGRRLFGRGRLAGHGDGAGVIRAVRPVEFHFQFLRLEPCSRQIALNGPKCNRNSQPN